MIQDVLHPLLETYGKPNDESEETFQTFKWESSLVASRRSLKVWMTQNGKIS